jgi:8-oxo-dGTP pyrophosphatase MutT (NUDIX family)
MIECSGALIYSRNTHRVLLLQKREGKHAGFWSVVGGTSNQNESAWQCLTREIEEEIQFNSDFIKSIPLDRFVSVDSKFNFHTYFCIIDDEFIPILSDEHIAWGWFDLNNLPKPTHRGLQLCLKNKVIQNKIKTIIDIVDLL